MSTSAGSKDSAKRRPRAGLIAGAVIALVIVTHGGIIPLFAGVLGLAASASLTMLLIIAAGALVENLLREHHKAIGRGGARAAKATAKGTAKHGGRLARHLHRKAGDRWARREHRPLMLHRRDQTVTGGESPDTKGSPTRRVDGKPETEADKRFFDLRESGYTGPIDQGGRAVPQLVKEKNMAADTDQRQASRVKQNGQALSAGGDVPAGWAAVSERVASAEWESDGELLQWMREEATGQHRYSESMVEAFEHGVNSIGLDPAALAALHDIADAASDMAERTAAARKHFAEFYQGTREDAAAGKLMPFNGRFMTGEGDA